MMTETMKNQKALIDGGFTDTEIAEWQGQQRQALSEAGFNQAEIDTEFGNPPLDPKPAAKVFAENVKKATQPETPGGEPKPVTNFMEALEAGFQGSVTGLLARGKNPDKALSEDAPMASRIAASIGSLAGDIPAMGAGALAGGAGGPVTATAGAFALPMGMRKVITDAYAKGEATTFPEFWERASGAIIETTKGLITGAATGLAGKAAGLLPIASPTAKAAATLGSEVSTMVTVGKALEGEVPNARDFVDAAVVIGGVKGAVKMAGKARDIYTKTGVKPDDLVSDMEKDVTIGQDLHAENLETPRAYQSAAAPTKSQTEGVWKHATNSPITALEKRPMYFDKEGDWGSYGDKQILDAELSLKKPLVESTITPEQYEQIAQKFSEMGGKPEDVDAFRTYVKNDTGDQWFYIPKELSTALEGMGYDGIIIDRSVKGTWAVALDPQSQVKMEGVGSGKPPVPPKPTPPAGSPEEAQQKVLSKVSIGERTDKEPMTFQRLYTDLIDDLNPIREAVKKAAKDGELPTSDDPYQLLRLTRGTFGKANQFLEYSTFDFKTYENNGPGLKAILQEGVGRELPDLTNPEAVDLNGFRAYAVAKRALELNERGINAGIDLDAAKTVVKNGKQYEPVVRELTAYQNRLTKYVKDAGIVSDEAYDAMLKANKDYIPFFRVMDDGEPGRPGGRGIRNPIKGIKGSERVIIDPLESIIKNTYVYLSLAERNAVGQKFIEMANKSGDPSLFYKKVAPELKATRVNEDEIRAMFGEFVKVRKTTSTERAETSKTTTAAGEEPTSKQGRLVREKVLEALAARGFSTGEAEQMVNRLSNKAADSKTVETMVKEIEKTEYVPELDIRLPNSVATIFRTVKTPLKDNEIAVFENGKYQKYEVDKDVAQAFNAVDAQTAGLLTKILAIPAKALRAGAVLSPDFMMRNFIRDQTMAFVMSKGGYFPVVDFMRGAFSLARKDQDFQNWLKSGGANAALIAMDRQYLQEQLSTITEVQGVTNKLWNTAKSSFEILRITSELIENSTRLGEYKRVSGGLQEKAAIQEGGMASREVTVDFARTGLKTRAASMISAFLNAAVQGEDRVIRSFAEKPLGTSVKMMTAITLPSIMLYLAQRDDPRWKEIPQWQKDLSWIILTKDHIYRIPKPHSAGIIFGSLPERMLEAFERDNPQAMKDLEKSFISSFFPNLIPTFAAPVVEQFANRSMFTGSPLIPAAAEKLLPEYQYTEYTTEAAKALGQLIGAFPGMRDRAVRDEDTFIGGVARALTTPALIENYVRSWTGGLGTYTLQIADKALREAGVLPDPVKPLATLSDLPVIKAFVVRYPSASAQSIQDFYDTYYAKKRVYDTFMAKVNEGDIKAADDVLKIRQDAWDELAGMRDTITEHASIVRMIWKMPGPTKEHPERFTAEDKRQLIDTLYFRMIEVSAAGNKAFEEFDRIMKDTQ